MEFSLPHPALYSFSLHFFCARTSLHLSACHFFSFMSGHSVCCVVWLHPVHPGCCHMTLPPLSSTSVIKPLFYFIFFDKATMFSGLTSSPAANANKHALKPVLTHKHTFTRQAALYQLQGTTQPLASYHLQGMCPFPVSYTKGLSH